MADASSSGPSDSWAQPSLGRQVSHVDFVATLARMRKRIETLSMKPDATTEESLGEFVEEDNDVEGGQFDQDYHFAGYGRQARPESGYRRSPGARNPVKRDVPAPGRVVYDPAAPLKAFSVRNEGAGQRAGRSHKPRRRAAKASPPATLHHRVPSQTMADLGSLMFAVADQPLETPAAGSRRSNFGGGRPKRPASATNLRAPASRSHKDSGEAPPRRPLSAAGGATALLRQSLGARPGVPRLSRPKRKVRTKRPATAVEAEQLGRWTPAGPTVLQGDRWMSDSKPAKSGRPDSAPAGRRAGGIAARAATVQRVRKRLREDAAKHEQLNEDVAESERYLMRMYEARIVEANEMAMQVNHGRYYRFSDYLSRESGEPRILILSADSDEVIRHVSLEQFHRELVMLKSQRTGFHKLPRKPPAGSGRNPAMERQEREQAIAEVTRAAVGLARKLETQIEQLEEAGVYIVSKRERALRDRRELKRSQASLNPAPSPIGTSPAGSPPATPVA